MAQLLSDNSHIPVRVAIFSGTSKADNMYSVREFGNQCILYSLDDVLRYGDVLNIIQTDETDRIKILSRGTIPKEQTVEGFFSGESVPVNKKLSEIFLQLHISEKTGRGVPKITEKYGRDAFEFREKAIVVKIPLNWINVMSNKVVNKPILEKVQGVHLNKTQMQILSYIRDNNNITKKQLQERTKKSKTTIDNAISFFKRNNLIERVGSNKAGYWKIND